MDVAQLVRRYLDEKAPAWSRSTLDHNRAGLVLFLRHLAETGRALTREAVLSFARSLEGRTRLRDGQPWGERTRQSALLALRGALKWALLRGLLFEDLSRLIVVKQVVALPRALAEPQLVRMIELGCAGTFAVRNRAILELFYGTGLRRGELSRLCLGDVALGEGELSVRQGKGRKDRVVPLGERAREALLGYLEQRPRQPGALFLSRHGRRLSGGMLSRIVKRAGLLVGVAGASPHRLRHSYATHLLRRGAGLRDVQALLGHESIASTEVYLKVEVSDLARMLERSHPRERG